MLSTLSKKYSLMPTCELLQDATKYIVNIEIPGVSKDKIKIQKENSKIGIKATKENPFKDMKVRSLFQRDFGNYSLSYTVPEDADINKLETYCDLAEVLEVGLFNYDREKIEQNLSIPNTLYQQIPELSKAVNESMFNEDALQDLREKDKKKSEQMFL